MKALLGKQIKIVGCIYFFWILKRRLVEWEWPFLLKKLDYFNAGNKFVKKVSAIYSKPHAEKSSQVKAFR